MVERRREELAVSPPFAGESTIDDMASLGLPIWFQRIIKCCLLVAIGIGLHRVFINNINWDEFNYLSQVHLYLNEALSLRLQTFHVHFFNWLPQVGVNEVDQVTSARATIWLMQLASLALIYRLARQYCSKAASFFVLLSFLIFGYVAEHGTSFRADPFCVVFFLLGLNFVLPATARPLRWAFAGAALAIAAMFSIKAVFYLPSFGLILLSEAFDRRLSVILTCSVTFVLSGIVFFAAIYALHDLALPFHQQVASADLIRSAGSKTLQWQNFIPQPQYLAEAVRQNAITFLLLLLGLSFVIVDTIRGAKGQLGRCIRIVAFAVPLTALAFYRNSFPYFYVFVIPAALILCGIALDRIYGMLARRRQALAITFLLLLLVPVGSYIWEYHQVLPDRTQAQRQTLDIVHRIFPEPVSYIDRAGMVSSFRKVNGFMSTWGMEDYRANGRPVMAEILRREQPPLLIANHAALALPPIGPNPRLPDEYSLLPEDYEVLRQNFLRYWGVIFIAGKRIELDGTATEYEFQVLIAGRYSLAANSAIWIDGRRLSLGESIDLDPGRHVISAENRDASGTVELRLEAARLPEESPPAEQPIFYGF